MKLIANVNGLRDVNGKDVAKDAEFEADDRYARIFVMRGKARAFDKKPAAKAAPAEPTLPLRTASMTPENLEDAAPGGERSRRRYQRRDLVAED